MNVSTVPSSNRRGPLATVPLLCAALVSVLAIHASAQTGKAREQVKQELVEAIRTGDILASAAKRLVN